MMGDSLSGYSVSDCTPPDSMYGCIVQHIKEKNPDTQISFYNRGIGGQVWGNANNLPGAFPAWYVDRQKPWLDYVGNDSNLLIVFYVQIMPDDFVMQLHRF